MRVGSALEGAPVIDYTTPGSRASRLRRWDKLRTDTGNLAEVRYHQALRYSLSFVMARRLIYHLVTTLCQIMKPGGCLAEICLEMTQPALQQCTTARRSGEGLLSATRAAVGLLTSFCPLQCHTVMPVTALHQAVNAKKVTREYNAPM